ncbi:polysaccharide deacetylase family protein [uncultured Desulfovibrio sp.]|uniref:polysaccharide deacetylase family protein n=1 Tax=uncultured Desulfovibrio sp. TaxID=167968 RepID=UPI002615724A|nr:polysaccharide deacetylase family protein [uncultured Desulfovibrio sp.]
MRWKSLIVLLCLAAWPPLGGIARGAAVVYDGPSISRQQMRENLCAITFDDGPSRNTGRLLDMLSSYGIHATFFLLGKNAALRPALVQRIVAEGHEVGNHSWSHPKLRALNKEQQYEELARTDALLRELGASPRHIRPPYGAYNEDTVDLAGDLGLSIMLWSQDSHDWKRLPVNYALLPNTLGHVYGPGELRGIFLFHDSLKRTVDDLPRIIAELRAGGCQRFVTVSEYLDVLDDTPPLLMTRRTPQPHSEQAEEMPPESFPDAMMATSGSIPAGSTPVPMARCSQPWTPAASTAPPRAALTADQAAASSGTVQALPEPSAAPQAAASSETGPRRVHQASAAQDSPTARQGKAPVYRVVHPRPAAAAPGQEKAAPRYRVVQPYPLPQASRAGTGRSTKGRAGDMEPRPSRAAAASDTF